MYNVMIVEDEKIIRNGLINMVERFANGFEVSDECENAYIAWDQFQIRKPDLIITDIRMRGMSGLELIEKIRARDENLPIIILSGFSDFAYAQSAIRLKITDYIVKPIKLRDFIEIMEKIRKLLDEEKPASPPETASQPGHFTIRKAEKYIKDHIGEDLNLALVAEKVGLNASYLSALFKTETQMNYSDFVLKNRMLKAKDLLQNTDFKIYEISEVCGYTSSKHFNSVFKKYFGVTPLQFRNEHGVEKCQDDNQA